MERVMKRKISFVFSMLLLGILGLGSAMAQPVEPFKLGTFEIDGEPRIGIVLRDRIVVELKAANRELERRPDVAKLPMPEDMKTLAGLYNLGFDRRIYQIVNHVVGGGLLDGAKRSYVHQLTDVRTLAPIDPGKILNAAGNYYGHVGEMNTPEEQRKEAEERRRNRGMAYLFLKPPSVVIANGEDIVIPKGRDKIDWECELGVIIGEPAKYVSAANAKNHIFGYTIELDMSDRGGRGEDPPRFGGSDWLIGKGHDTFAPLGPFIVPAEFVKDPMNLKQTLTVNGKLMQDAHSSDMIHNVYELIEYGSGVLTLETGDVVAGGSPAGTGMSRSVRAEQIFLKPGDKIVATIEGIGTMTHDVKGEEAASAGPTASQPSPQKE
jgi:2-keto-4-pentenoate hydratase/2-oxohepta-3-ene-1,7-dioic acid hydratase in catechol pathway